MTEKLADIGVTGLAVMGSNIARNFAHKGHKVALHNRSYEKTKHLMDNFGSEGDFVPSESIKDFVKSLATPRKVLIMVQAGAATDAVIEELAGEMESGDIIIDGGNSLFTDTIKRESALKEKGIRFIGAGISGGEEGALNGPSIMPGGPKDSYKFAGPILESISAKVDGVPCCTHIGPDGSGHFVKMVHNGIEYVDMQLIGEAYHLLRNAAGIEPFEQSKVFADWNKGELESYLIEITAEVLAQKDSKTDKPLVDVIVDAAGQKGTGTWTVKSALDLGVPTTGIAEAVFARGLSSSPDIRAIGQGLKSGKLDKAPGDSKKFIDEIKQALWASKIIAYAQGFDQIIKASNEYKWGVNPGDLATIWRGGCIIRAQFLNRIMDAYKENPKLPSLFDSEYFKESVESSIDSLRTVVIEAIKLGIPVPAFSSALAYYDGIRSERLPAALTQGLRDFFGAHTYKRIDAEGSFHTLWSGDRSEVKVS